MMTDRQGAYGEIVERISVARRQMAALAISIGAQDQLGALVVGVRLERALVGIASWLDDHTDIEDDITLASTIELLTDRAAALLALAPRRLHLADGERIVRWEHARRRSDAIRPAEPDLFELDASTRYLALAKFSALHVAHGRFLGATLDEAMFDNVLLEGCDLARASLERTTWGAAKAVRCAFVGANLTDANLDHATFVDCDLYGADLRSVDLGSSATAVKAEFIRCDLRGTRWNGRTLARTKFYRCRFHGSVGARAVDDVEIYEPDVSPTEEPRIGQARDVIGSWQTRSSVRTLPGLGDF